MRTYDSVMRSCAHDARMYSFSCLFNRVLREREISGREGERQCTVRLRRLHDTYFYARSFAPAYGRARATRIDEAWSALCHIYKS